MKKIGSNNKAIKVIGIIVIVLIGIICTIFLSGIFFDKVITKKENQIILKEAQNYFNGLKTQKDIGTLNSIQEITEHIIYVINYPIINNDKLDQIIKNKVSELNTTFTSTYENQEGTYKQYIDYDLYLGADQILNIVLYETILKDSEIMSDNIYVSKIHNISGEEIKDKYVFVNNYETKLKDHILNYIEENKENINLIDNYEDTLSKTIKYTVTKEDIKLHFTKKEIFDDNEIHTISIPFSEIEKNLNIDITNSSESVDNNAVINNEFNEQNINKYLNHQVNVYSYPNKNGEKIADLKSGTKVKVIGESESGWSKIKYQEQEAYIESRYLNSSPLIAEGFTEVKENLYIVSYTEVYKEPNTESEIIGTLEYQDSFTRIGKTEEWSEIIINDDVGFIKNQTIINIKPEKYLINIDIAKNRNIDPNKPMVALTFDDGPSPTSTLRILNTLEKYNAVATFFELGMYAEKYPDIIKKEEEIGCEVGSHSYSHKNFNVLSASEILKEANTTNNILENILGHKVNLLRPPYGNANKLVKAVLSYALINWDIDTLDWKTRNRNAILKEIRKIENYDGRIILMHSIYGTTADAVEIIVPELINKGYQLVTISEMAKYKGKTLESGKIYYNFK